MPSIHAIDIGDVVKFYHRKFITGKKFINVARDYRRYDVADEFRRRLQKIPKDSKSFHHALLISGYDNNQDDSFFQPDSLTRQNLGQEGVSYWHMGKTGYLVDRREPGWPSNATADQIVNHLHMQETNMYDQWFKRQQQRRWLNPTAPNDGTTAQIQPYGIPHYVTQSATAAVGQNGLVPTGYTTVSGLSRTTYPQLKNWTGTYSDMSPTGGQKKVSEMIDMMGYVAPREDAQEEAPKLAYEILSHYQPWQEYQDSRYGFDDNVGADQGKFRGMVPAGGAMFRGITWNWVDALTRQYLRDGTTLNPAYDSGRPIYILDWSTWFIYAAKGFFMERSDPEKQDNPHNSYAIHMDSIYQRVCWNPGANGVLKAA